MGVTNNCIAFFRAKVTFLNIGHNCLAGKRKKKALHGPNHFRVDQAVILLHTVQAYEEQYEEQY